MKRVLLVLPVALLAAGYGYTAAFRVLTDSAAFADEVGPDLELEDFETAPLGTVLPGTAPLFGDLIFTYDGVPDRGEVDIFLGQPLIINAGLVNGTREFMGEVNADGTPSGLHFFTFPYSVYSFGGTFNSATSGARLTLKFGDELVALADYREAGDPGTGFFGVISEAPFESVAFGVEATFDPSIGKSSEVFRLDDVVYADGPVPPPVVPAVPLPASAWALALGLGLLGLQRKRATVPGAPPRRNV